MNLLKTILALVSPCRNCHVIPVFFVNIKSGASTGVKRHGITLQRNMNLTTWFMIQKIRNGIWQMASVANAIEELPMIKADEAKEFVRRLAAYILGENK